jgi:transcriptional regulator with XRE-family HTH domain|tara:strand:- start:1522 stop:1914 length:393 start_codon:yes stop_codon:yes gene_type:complete
MYETGIMMQLSQLRLLQLMDFPQRLATLRKEKGFTQQTLADEIGLHISQLKRYEAGTSQPTLEVLRNLAIALSVSADVLLFDKEERGPDEDLRLQFEAVQQFTPEEKQVAKTVLEGLILKHDATRFNRVS